MICLSICDKCKHEHEELYDGWMIACDAFPKGHIPREITKYANEGDDIIKNCANGIGFEPKSEYSNND